MLVFFFKLLWRQIDCTITSNLFACSRLDRCLCWRTMGLILLNQ